MLKSTFDPESKETFGVSGIFENLPYFLKDFHFEQNKDSALHGLQSP